MERNLWLSRVHVKKDAYGRFIATLLDIKDRKIRPPDPLVGVLAPSVGRMFFDDGQHLFGPNGFCGTSKPDIGSGAICHCFGPAAR